MDTRTDSRLSPTQAEPIEPGGGAWRSLLAELTLELPASLVRGAVTLGRRAGGRPHRDGIALSSMSDDWLREFVAGERGRDEP
jgi:hypothetical protein